MEDEPHRERLARCVQDRRRELRLSVRAAAQLAGIDRATWSSAEAATRRTAEYHYAGIENALQWAPGSIDAILSGGAPTPRVGEALAAPRERDEEVQLVLDDPTLSNRMKQRIIEMVYERRERDRAAGIEDTRRVIELFKNDQSRGA